MSDSKETVSKNKGQAPAIEMNSILKRIEKLEGRCTQLEITLGDTITFGTLTARITGKKTAKKKTSETRIVTRRES